MLCEGDGDNACASDEDHAAHLHAWSIYANYVIKLRGAPFVRPSRPDRCSTCAQCRPPVRSPSASRNPPPAAFQKCVLNLPGLEMMPKVHPPSAGVWDRLIDVNGGDKLEDEEFYEHLERGFKSCTGHNPDIVFDCRCEKISGQRPVNHRGQHPRNMCHIAYTMSLALNTFRRCCFRCGSFIFGNTHD